MSELSNVCSNWPCVQAELLEQSNLISDLASKLEIVTTDVHGLGR